MKPLTGRDEQPKAPGRIATVALFGAFGPPILTAARSLRNAGIDPVVLGVGNSAPQVWSSAVRFAAYMPLEDVGTPAGIAIISDFIQRTNAEALLAFWDPEMLWLPAT